MDTNTGESPGHQSQSQQLGNSPSEEAMGHWTPTGIEPMVYDDDDDSLQIILTSVLALISYVNCLFFTFTQETNSYDFC